MSRYERTYGSDWERLDRDDAVERAYALGVAASLDEHHPEELAAIRTEMDSAYQRSVVDLAFDEGKAEARELSTPEDGEGDVWSRLVESEDADPENGSPGELGDVPELVEKLGALDRPEPDSTSAVDLPAFLRRDSDE